MYCDCYISKDTGKTYEKDIENSFNKAVTHEKFKPNYYFGNGYSSDVIIENIVKFLDIS